MKDYHNLEVWKRAHALVLNLYKLSKSFPDEERYGLTSQISRSAEGCGRLSDRELARFVEIAHGSASETEYHLLLARDLGYADVDYHYRLADEVSQITRMLGALSRKLRSDS